MQYAVELETLWWQTGKSLEDGGFSAHYEMTLPFAPYPGLRIVLTKEGEENGHDFKCGDVTWNHLTKSFLCSAQSPLDLAEDLVDVSKNLEGQGWKLFWIGKGSA